VYFSIISTQYRGVFDKKPIDGKSDEFGGSDANNVVKLMDFIPHIRGTKTNGINRYETNRGGMQTFFVSQ
jgi:hypothetical protein